MRWVVPGGLAGAAAYGAMPEPIVGVRCTQARQPTNRDVSVRAFERVPIRAFVRALLDVGHGAIIAGPLPVIEPVFAIAT